MAEGYSRRWHLYVLSVLPFIAGSALCVWLGMRAWNGLVAFDNSLVRIVVPGEKAVVLPAAGNYTIFHEHRSFVDGVVYSSPEDSVTGLSCRMKDKDTGHGVRLEPSAANMTYSFGSREGRAVFGFKVDEGGPYIISCGFEETRRDGVKTVLAVGQGFGAEIFNTISFVFAIISIFIISFGASAAAVVYLIVKKPKGSANA